MEHYDFFFLFFFIFIIPFVASQTCSDYSFSNSRPPYTTCTTLPVLDSFLHWNYHQANHTVDIAYRHTGVTTANWIVWSLNPGSGQMLGAQCLVAYRNSTGLIHAYTSPIADYSTTLQEAPLSFPVLNMSAEYNNNQMILYANIQLPAGRTSFTQVWQHGDLSTTGTPDQHPSSGGHLSSFGTIDFATGTASSGGSTGGGSRQRNRNVHGVLNVVSWGILLPLGAMAARYLKVFKEANPAWFYLHITCQSSAYIVGVAGWGTGLRLGRDSPGLEQTIHRNIGITIFVFGTLQVFALLLRPKPDHKYRFYWNIYHHLIGYSVIVLSIVNIFEGLDILDPEEKWRRAYIGILIFFGACIVVLEPVTWYVVIKRRRKTRSEDKNSNAPAHAGNGYDA